MELNQTLSHRLPPNCSTALLLNSTLSAFPDIGGVGVLVTFRCNTGIIFLGAGLFYYFSYDLNYRPSENQRRQNSGPSSWGVRSRRWIISKWCSRFDATYNSTPMFQRVEYVSRKEEHIRQIIAKIALNLIDSHFITNGIILIASYATIGTDGFSVYHWKILCSFGWTSVLVCGSALIILRLFLRKHPVGRRWRLFSLFSYAATITASMILVLAPIDSRTAVICAWKTFGFQNASIALIRIQIPVLLNILSVGAISVTVLTDVSPRVSNLIFVKGKNAVGLTINKISSLESTNNKWYSAWWNYGLIRPLNSTLRLLYLLVELHESTLSKLFYMASGIAWGILHLNSIRSKDYLIPEGDNTWSFSQVLSVLSLSIPVVVVVSTIQSSRGQSEDPIGNNIAPVLPSEDFSGFGPIPLPAHLMVQPQDAPGENPTTMTDGSLRKTNSWKPWVIVIIGACRLTLITNIFYCFLNGNLSPSLLLDTIVWYVGGQCIILVLFIQLSTAFEMLLLESGVMPEKQPTIKAISNGICFTGSITWIFFSCAGTLSFLPESASDWLIAHEFHSILLYGTEADSVYMIVQMPHGLAILLWIILGIVLAYQLICFIACLKPIWEQKMGRPRTRDNDVELGTLA